MRTAPSEESFDKATPSLLSSDRVALCCPMRGRHWEGALAPTPPVLGIRDVTDEAARHALIAMVGWRGVIVVICIAVVLPSRWNS